MQGLCNIRGIKPRQADDRPQFAGWNLRDEDGSLVQMFFRHLLGNLLNPFVQRQHHPGFSQVRGVRHPALIAAQRPVQCIHHILNGNLSLIFGEDIVKGFFNTGNPLAGAI